MLGPLDKEGGSKKGKKHADVILEWSLIQYTSALLNIPSNQFYTLDGDFLNVDWHGKCPVLYSI